MNSSDTAGATVKPHITSLDNTLAKYTRKFTSNRIRFRPRTRAIFVFVGAVAIIVAWLTPWYTSLTWNLPRNGMKGITGAGYELTNLSPGDIYAKWGLTPWFKSYTGQDLSTGPAVLRQIAFSRNDFYTWIALAVLAFIAIWIFERPQGGTLTTVAHKRIYVFFESAKVILLVFVVARCVWKGFDLADRAKVHALAEKALYGATLPSHLHFVTNYSFGLAILPLGLIFAALGVLSGDKEPKPSPGTAGNAMTGAASPITGPAKIRVKAWVMAVIAILFILITYGLFN